MHERARRWRGIGAAVAVGLIAGACGFPAPSGTPPVSSAGSTGSPSPIDASGTIRIGTNEPITMLSNAATDEASRTALKELMYEQQPHLFAWSERTSDAFDVDMRSSSEDLQLDSPIWDWQLETLYLAE